MPDTYRIYKGNEKVAESENPITLAGLQSNTKYEAGTFKIARVKGNEESEKIPISEFTTLASIVSVTEVTLSPKTSTANAGVASSRQLTATVTPVEATNKKVSYKIEPATEGLDVSDSGNITWTETVPAGEYVTTVTTEDGNKTDTNTLTLTKTV